MADRQEMIEKYAPKNETLQNIVSSEKMRKNTQNTTDQLQRKKGVNSQIVSENIQKQSNGVSKKFAELAPSIGNMAVGAAVSSVNPMMGTGYFVGSATGDYYDDAKQRGMTEEQANTYSTIMGAMEGVTEGLTWGNLKKFGSITKGLITGTTKNLAKDAIEVTAKSKVKEALKDYGIGITENLVQEAIIEPISETTATLVGGSDKANWDNIGDRMLKSGIDGALTAIITGGANAGIQSCIGLSQKIAHGQKPTQTEIKSAVQDASKEINVESIVKDEVNNAIQREYRDYNTNKPVDTNTQNWLNKAQDIINQNNVENNQNSLYNNINESESDINGYNENEQRGIEKLYQYENGTEQGQGRNRIDNRTEESIMGSKDQNDAETQLPKEI